MQLVVVAVGSRMPPWVDAAFADYAARMPGDLAIVLKAVRPASRTEGKPGDALLGAEAARIRDACPARGPRIALDERGIEVDSVSLAAHLGRWRDDGDDVAFLVGGPDGLDAALKREAALRVRLSAMTLPHALARVVLAEQLYRAWTLLAKHPYHRA